MFSALLCVCVYCFACLHFCLLLCVYLFACVFASLLACLFSYLLDSLVLTLLVLRLFACFFVHMISCLCAACRLLDCLFGSWWVLGVFVLLMCLCHFVGLCLCECYMCSIVRVRLSFVYPFVRSRVFLDLSVDSFACFSSQFSVLFVSFLVCLFD